MTCLLIFYILKIKQNGKTKPTGTAGEHPAPRPRNKNRSGTCGTFGEGGKIFGTQKTDTTETQGTTTHKNKISHTKIKWNNYPLKQKNNAKNYKQNETKRENRTQKNQKK